MFTMSHPVICNPPELCASWLADSSAPEKFENSIACSPATVFPVTVRLLKESPLRPLVLPMMRLSTIVIQLEELIITPIFGELRLFPLRTTSEVSDIQTAAVGLPLVPPKFRYPAVGTLQSSTPMGSRTR